MPPNHDLIVLVSVAGFGHGATGWKGGWSAPQPVWISLKGWHLALLADLRPSPAMPLHGALLPPAPRNRGVVRHRKFGGLKTTTSCRWGYSGAPLNQPEPVSGNGSGATGSAGWRDRRECPVTLVSC